MLVCCRRTWFRCWVDQALHVIGINSRRVCDWHDRAIIAD